MSGKKLFVLVAFAFTVSALLIYSNVLKGEFVFDDYEYITQNDAVHDFSHFSLSDPRQVGYLTFALNYAIGKEDTLGYHVVNIAIHATNAIILFFLVRALLAAFDIGKGDERGDIKIPLVAASLFLVHPLQTQAVSYITQRFTSLATLFYLAAVYLYILARMRLEKEQKSATGYGYYAASFIAVILAMRTKEISFTIPFMIAAAELFLFRRSVFGRRRFYLLMPFAASLVIIPLSILGPEIGLLSPGQGILDATRLDKISDLRNLSPYEYMLTQFRVIVIYIKLLFLPIRQSAIYDLKASRTFIDPSVLLSLSTLVFVIFAGIFAWLRSARRSGAEALRLRLFSAGIFWFFLASSVESSIIPIKDMIFEHRVYLPSAGAFMSVAVLLAWAADRCLKGKSRMMRTTAALIVCLPLGFAAHARNDVWSTELKFWDDVVRKLPNKPIGYNNRSHAYLKAGQLDKALEDANTTIGYFQSGFTDNPGWEKADLNPGNMSKTYMQRSIIYERLGMHEQAEADAKRSDEIAYMLPALIELSAKADMYFRRGEFKEAVNQYNKLLDWDPGNADVLNARGSSYMKSGNYAEAIKDFDSAIAVNPGYAAAFYNRGLAYDRSGPKEKSSADFAQACKLGSAVACEAKKTAPAESGK